METIRVIIIDEQPLFREGIRATLLRMGDCDIVGESTAVLDVLEIVRTCNPDVALIDAGLTFSDPLEIARQMRYLAPRIAIIILSPSKDEERLFQAIKVGAAAYFTRNLTPDELVDAIRKVSHGEYLIDEDVLAKQARCDRLGLHESAKPEAIQSCLELRGRDPAQAGRVHGDRGGVPFGPRSIHG